MRKKQIVVVKSLRESTSPRRKLLVSRSLSNDEYEDEGFFADSCLGNTSPKVSIQTITGNFY
jgi:hypothetical protein